MTFRIKKTIKRICPKFMFGFAARTLRGIRTIRCRLDMMLHPSKMMYFCPCCGIRVRSFVEGDYRNMPKRFNQIRYEHSENMVLCPLCRALPRHRILALWCESHRNLFSSDDILYFAPEYSMMRWMRKNKIKCTTADLFAKADLQLDIQDTGLPQDSYDVIICNHVLEHVDDFRMALREMFRILRPGGTFICSFPMDPQLDLVDEDSNVVLEEERLERFGQNDHKRVFGMSADAFLVEAGFEVTKIEGANYPDAIFPVVGPADYDVNVLFVGKKKAGTMESSCSKKTDM